MDIHSHIIFRVVRTRPYLGSLRPAEIEFYQSPNPGANHPIGSIVFDNEDDGVTRYEIILREGADALTKLNGLITFSIGSAMGRVVKEHQLETGRIVEYAKP